MAESYITRKGGGGGGGYIINGVEATGVVRSGSNIKKGDLVETIITNYTTENIGSISGAFDNFVNTNYTTRYAKISEKTVLFFYCNGSTGLRFNALARDKNNNFEIKNSIQVFANNVDDLSVVKLRNNTVAIFYFSSANNRFETRLIRYDEEANTATIGAAQHLTSLTPGGNYFTGKEISDSSAVFAYQRGGQYLVVVFADYNTDNLTLIFNTSNQPSTTIISRPLKIGILLNTTNERFVKYATSNSPLVDFFVDYTNNDATSNTGRVTYQILNLGSGNTPSLSITSNGIIGSPYNLTPGTNSWTAVAYDSWVGNFATLTVHMQTIGTNLSQHYYIITNLRGARDNQQLAFRRSTVEFGTLNLYSTVRLFLINEFQAVFLFKKPSVNGIEIRLHHIGQQNIIGGNIFTTITPGTFITDRHFTFNFNDGTILLAHQGSASGQPFQFIVLRPTFEIRELEEKSVYKPNGIAQEDGLAGQTVKITTI